MIAAALVVVVTALLIPGMLRPGVAAGESSTAPAGTQPVGTAPAMVSETATPSQTATSSPSATPSQSATATLSPSATADVTLTALASSQTAIASQTAEAFATQGAQVNMTQTAVVATQAAFTTQTAVANATGTAAAIAQMTSVAAAQQTAQVGATGTAAAYATGFARQLEATSTAAALARAATETAVASASSGTQTAVAVASATSAAAATQTAVVANPIVFGLTPAFGPTTGGTSVIVVGSGFRPGATVAFGGAPASSVTVAAGGGSISAVTPPGTAGGVTVAVTNPDSRSGSLPFAFQYLNAPSPTTMNPRSGPLPGGTVVVLEGTNLDAVTSVTFGGSPGVVLSVAATRLAVMVPPGAAAGLVGVIVNSPGGSVASPVSFTYVDATGSTAIAVARQTAEAAGTGVAVANATATAHAMFAIATQTASAAGNSPSSATALTIGTTLSTGASTVQKFYSFAAVAGRTYQATTGGSAGDVDTTLFLYRLEAGVARPIRFASEASGPETIVHTAAATETLYLGVAAFTGSGSYSVAVTDVTAQSTPIATRTPTATFTVTPTATVTWTAIAAAAPDAFEPDLLPSQGPLLTLNGGPVSRTFHDLGDINHARFVVNQAGRYTIRTSALTGGADTHLTLLNGDGSIWLDPSSRQPLLNNDDLSADAEARTSRLDFYAGAGDVGSTFAVRVRNLSVNAGAGVGYAIRAEFELPSSPTATRTATVTPAPTRAPATADPYEALNDDALATAPSYSLRSPIVHSGSQSINGNAGPQHTFHEASDLDWLKLELGALQGGTRLRVELTDFGRLQGTSLRTEPVLSIWRPDSNLTSGQRLVRFVTSCPRIRGERSVCADITFDAGDAILYSGQTWSIQIRNSSPDLYGAEMYYSLRVELNQPGADVPPTATATVTNTGTPTVTRTPIPPEPEDTATHTPTITGTATPTSQPIVALFDPSRGALLQSSNNDTVVNVPPGVRSDRQQLAMDVETRNGADSRAQFQVGNGLVTLRSISARAFDSDGNSISELDAEISFCVTFTIGDVAGLDQSSLRPYYVDPRTGARSTVGITLTRFVPATASQLGTLCFSTTHLTEFELAGGEEPTPTPRPSRTPTPTATPVNNRVRLIAVFNNVDGFGLQGYDVDQRPAAAGTPAAGGR